MEQFIIEIAKATPQIAILVYFVRYFQKQLGIKDVEIKSLNKILMEQQKDTINAMTSLTTVIEDIKELIKSKLK